MARLHIRTYGDDVLRKKTKYIKTYDRKLLQLIEDMFDFMYEAGGIGLAAPQVGISRKLIVVDTFEEGEKFALANPKIIWESDEILAMKEGCLSIPGVEGEVLRSRKIKVKYNDPETGVELTMEASDLLARVIAHETDHLNGVLFVDHLHESEFAQISRKLQELAAA
ncbi:MAG: peptide deformylase [Candidatus Omnitrophota bacterium]|nr:MAG: peptide deformylase [Candidatus Omnitrophota bacterium]